MATGATLAPDTLSERIDMSLTKLFSRRSLASAMAITAAASGLVLMTPGAAEAAILAWLAQDYGVGRGHAMAFFHVLKNGTEISDKHVGSSGAHRDDSTTLRIDGIANRDCVVK